MMQQRAPTEDEKMAGLQRLSNRYQPTESPVVVKGREDYKRLKLTEAFNDLDTSKDGFITLDELIQHLTRKGQKARDDPTYQLSLAEIDKIQLLFDLLDLEKTGSVGM